MEQKLPVPDSLSRVMGKADRFAYVVGVPQRIARALFIKYYKIDKSRDEEVKGFVSRYTRIMKEVKSYD